MEAVRYNNLSNYFLFREDKLFGATTAGILSDQTVSLSCKLAPYATTFVHGKGGRG